MSARRRSKTSAEDFASAALRHLRDAQALLDSSPDQAWHLAGYAPECASKSALMVDQGWGRALGHDLHRPGVLNWALSLSPRASERRPPSTPRGWRPDCRYEASGSYNTLQAQQLLKDCEGEVLRTLAYMWVEGSLRGGPDAAL